MHDALVDEETVRALAVIAEALAVVAHDDDHRAVEEVLRVELRDEAADLRVDERDLAVVRMPGVARLERLGRIVRGVRVVEMHPGEERASV